MLIVNGAPSLMLMTVPVSEPNVPISLLPGRSIVVTALALNVPVAMAPVPAMVVSLAIRETVPLGCHPS